MVKFVKILAKTFLYSLVIVFFLLFGISVLLKAPGNQTLLARYFSPKIEQSIGYPLTFERIQFKFFDELSLWNVQVKDPWGKEMIKIEQLDVNFNLSDLFLHGDKPTMEFARLVKPKVHLIFDKKDGKMNMDEFIVRLTNWLSNPNAPKNAPSALFKIKEVDVINGQFLLDDDQVKNLSSPKNFDISHFSLAQINSKVHNFWVYGDTIALQTIGFKAIDPMTKFKVHRLDTKFLICEKQMRFDQLSLFFNQSWLGNKVTMNYKNFKSLKNWNRNVFMRANFKGAKVKGEDLGRFVNAMYDYPGVYRLNGQLAGTVSNLKLQKFSLGFGQKSALKGDFTFKGLPEIKKTKMDFAMQGSTFFPNDLAIFISTSAAQKMKILGAVNFSGTFNGTHSAFSTFGKLKTGLGYLEAKFQLNLKDSMARSSYDGQVNLTKFKLGKLLDLQEYLGTIDLNGRIKGTGFSNKSANVDFDGNISEINFHQYSYKRVNLKGNLQKQMFKGIVSVRDSNLLANMIGEINLRGKRPHYQLNGLINRANLHALHWVNDPLKISSEFEVDLFMNNLDDLEGKASLTDIVLSKPKIEDLPVRLLSFQADLSNPSKKTYKINSDLLSAELTGSFTPSVLQQNFNQLVQELALYFKPNQLERLAYYVENKPLVGQKYQSEFSLTFHEPKPILSRWFPSIEMSKNTVFFGSLNSARSFQFSLESYPDTLVFGNYKFYQSIFSLQGSKFLGSPELSSSLLFQSRKQQLNFLAPTELLKFDALWDQDRIHFNYDFKQQGEENSAHLSGLWKFENEGFGLKFKDSYFRILGQDWAIDPRNQISLLGKDWKAENLYLSNQDQLIAMNGSLSKDSSAVLSLKAEKFQLATLGPLFSVKSNGILNAELNLKNWYQNSEIDSWMKIDSLYLGKVYVGNVQALGNFSSELNAMDLDVNVNRFDTSILIINGLYRPSEEEQKLDLIADLNKTDLKILEPFTQGVFSNFSGDAVGKLHITGHFREPEIEGKIVVNKAGVTFDYLNTQVFVSDTVQFFPRKLVAKNWISKDSEGNQAKLNVDVNFPKGKEFNLEVSADLNRYKILNTKRNASSIYYGLGYGTGPMRVSGTLKNLLIFADLKTEKGSRLYIPLDRDYGSSSSNEYQLFSTYIQQEQSLEKGEQVATKLNEDGIELDLNLKLTPEAYGEVLFDSQKGDLMRVYGNGQIKMTLDKKGKFLMNGDYAIEQGDYTFSLQNIINKKFNIERNSKISWSGDPLDAKVDIKAVYTQYASLFPILLDTTNKSKLPEFKKRYPVDIAIMLKNRLLSPDVNFDINIRDYPKDVTFNGSVTAFQNRIKTDEQELTKQVSNVLLFGQLVSPFGSSGLTLGNLMGNFTEMLSNQLGNLASKIDKDLNVDVYLGGGSFGTDLLSNLQLRASYNLNDRLRLTRSGGFTDARNQTSPQLLLGDWSVEWFATQDGSVRLKGYNRNVQTSLAGSLNSYQINQTFGASILFQRNFNKFFWQK